MRAASHPAEYPRRVPQQERGERRVAQLLDAASDAIAAAGYENATMADIAERAGAPIGSLYQFFPNKGAIAYALRTACGKDYEALLARLESKASTLSIDRLVADLLAMTMEFIETHRAFLALLDAPSSTRSPALRSVMRTRLARCFVAIRPAIKKEKAIRLATVTLQMIKGLNQLYAEAKPEDRKQLVREYRAAITCYLRERMGSES